ncbi:MAG: ABC transporter substrate-binding protein [Bradyrhizobium sp.]|uniref:ABC transporter substrate-binding protein n=1 Tax=Bradyrhizobium sp. TaxID=376 RepID=UPI0035473BD1
MTPQRRFRPITHWKSSPPFHAALLIGVLLAGPAGAAPGDKFDVLRDLATRVGAVVGSALTCKDVARQRVQTVVDKFTSVIREASTSEAERTELTHALDRGVTEGRTAVAVGKTDCRTADRQLADLERSVAGPSLSAVIGPAPANAAPAQAAPAQAPAAAAPAAAPSTVVAAASPTQVVTPPGPVVRGITDKEIRFGMAAPFSGSARELGRQMKLGIETAFERVNEAGGIHGRMLKLYAADDGYEPSRTTVAMKQLYEKDQVFGIVGNVGTPTAVVAIPYSLERRMLFFGAFTGAGLLRNDPPDRYVFNYRASYAEETDAVVRYLVKIRKIPLRNIAVFAQQDSYGDAGFQGVAKAFRAMGGNDATILRLGYKRNTVDVDEAVNQLKAQKTPIKAVVMVGAYRACAKFIEKTKDLVPGLVYTNVSFVGSTALADELMLLGPKYAAGVIVTQVVPAVSGYSSVVLEYKNALAKYFPGEAPDYVSLEGYVAASVLIQALNKVGRQFDTEKLVDTLEAMRELDLGLGTKLGFGRAEHQASHKIWGTAIDEQGKYQAIELE